MTWLVSVLVALICGVVGLFLGGFIANSCVTWYQISSREGESGYFVIFIAIGGGIAGLILGFIAADSTIRAWHLLKALWTTNWRHLVISGLVGIVPQSSCCPVQRKNVSLISKSFRTHP